MHVHPATYLSVLTTLVPFAFANFDVYADHYRHWNGKTPDDSYFRVFGSTPDDACKYIDDERNPSKPF